MEAILENKALRRSFWVSFGLSLLVIFIVRVMLGSIDEHSMQITRTAAIVLETLFATLLTTGMVGAFLFYLTPENSNPKQLEILQPIQISQAFNDALNNTRSWSFNGGFGRYLRSATIPKLSDAARKQRITIGITGQILDPRNTKLCEKHANLRNSVKTIDGEKSWTTNDVRTELYSTVLVALIEGKRNANLDIKIYLLNHFTPTRIDLSSEVGILTKEDRKAPAIRVKKGTYFYDSYSYELDVVKSQGFQVPPTEIPCDFPALTGPKAKELLQKASLWSDDIDPLLDKICETVNTNRNPYG